RHGKGTGKARRRRRETPPLDRVHSLSIMSDDFGKEHAKQAAPGPAPSCWSCGARFETRFIARDGIIRSRREREGGPYRLYTCPHCFRLNLCERTLRGRWFSSPTFRPNIFEYLIGRLFLDDATDFIRAVAWYEENEDRRRYFFERDGDRRYSDVSFFGRLWPWSFPSVPAAADNGRPDGSRSQRDQTRERASGTRGSASGRDRDGQSRARGNERDHRRDERERVRPRDDRTRVASPWTI